jgi:hypothetical protein
MEDLAGQITEQMQGRTFVHQCPVCRMWQVDYTEWVYLTDATLKAAPDGSLTADLSLCDLMVEDVVAEHYKAAHPEEYAAVKG